MKIAIGCDHVGFELKGKVIEHLKEKGIEVVDFGTNSTERTDYPIYGKAIRLSFIFNICKHLYSLCMTSALINAGEPCVNNHQSEVKSDNSCAEGKHICIIVLS